MKRILLLAALALLLLNPVAWAARVVLTNGSTFVGSLLRQDETSVTLRTELGEITFSRAQIERLEGVPSLVNEPAVAAPAPRPAPETVVPDPAPSWPAPEQTERQEAHRTETPVSPRPFEEPPRASDPGSDAPGFGRGEGFAEERPGEWGTTTDLGDSIGEGSPPAPREFLPYFKTALGRPGAAWGIGFLAGVFAVYVAASFVVGVLIAWGVSHMMSSIQEPSFGSALKVCAIQWVAAIVVMGVCGFILGMLGALSDPRQLAVAGTGACCALPVVIVVLAAVNIGTVARVFNLGIGSAFVFVLGQGFFGWLADALLRHVVVGVLRG